MVLCNMLLKLSGGTKGRNNTYSIAKWTPPSGSTRWVHSNTNSYSPENGKIQIPFSLLFNAMQWWYIYLVQIQFCNANPCQYPIGKDVHLQEISIYEYSLNTEHKRKFRPY
jgi:hypothetical protein